MTRADLCTGSRLRGLRRGGLASRPSGPAFRIQRSRDDTIRSIAACCGTA